MGELETTARADHEHAAVVRHRLRQDLLDDAVQDIQAGDRAARPAYDATAAGSEKKSALIVPGKRGVLRRANPSERMIAATTDAVPMAVIGALAIRPGNFGVPHQPRGCILGSCAASAYTGGHP